MGIQKGDPGIIFARAETPFVNINYEKNGDSTVPVNFESTSPMMVAAHADVVMKLTTMKSSIFLSKKYKA